MSFREIFQNCSSRFIDNHNAQVEEEKRFKVGKVTVKDANGYINRSDTQYLSTYDSIFKKLIDTHGGIFEFPARIRRCVYRLSGRFHKAERAGY